MDYYNFRRHYPDTSIGSLWRLEGWPPDGCEKRNCIF